MSMYLLIPLVALVITQFFKLGVDYVRGTTRGFSWSDLNSYGGMPSAHSAMFASSITVVAYRLGVDSFAFAISVIMYLVVVRDAMGIRWHLGEHGAILKQLIEEHVKDHDHITHDKIVTRLGHRPIEVAVGTLCGVVIAFIMMAAF